MALDKDLTKGTWVFRGESLFNDDQKLNANSVGRVSQTDGSLTTVQWLGPPIPIRIPVHSSSLKCLNGHAEYFEEVLVGVERIHKEFLFITRGDPSHLHSPAIHTLLSAVYNKLKPLCPKAARNIELAIEDFDNFCKTKQGNYAEWFHKDLSDALKALPWV